MTVWSGSVVPGLEFLSMRKARAGAFVALAAIVTSLLPAVAIASTRQTSVVLVLRPMSAAKLRALAADHAMSRARRAAALAAVVPTTSRRASVAAAAHGAGLTVAASSPWTVRVRATADRVASLFGQVASAPDRLGRSYPRVPASLRPYVVAALPTSGHVARPLASSPVTGKDLRAAYSAPNDTNLGAGFTVATVQLAGWAGLPDLQQFAQHQSPPLPTPTSSTYVERSIDGGDPRGNDHQDGDSEVALDQEALLTVAPSATQLAYFAPNDDGGQGYLDAVRQVGADVLSGSANTGALSLSWGGCEASYDRAWIAAMDQALAYTVAAGVTVFAASGDQGSADCVGQIPGPQQAQPAVDYPASSPYAVAVGGTSLPNPQQPSTAQGWFGSGGGESSVERMPAWQTRERGLAPHGRRLVPDIASDADAASGLQIYNSRYVDPATGQPTPQSVVGGTSLAAPTQAALLVDTLASAGWSRGVGDIHQALYTAGGGGFTDITSDKPADDGSTGNGAYHSAPGFDLVTGLGTPVWTGLAASLGAFQLRTPRTTRSLTVGLSELMPSSTMPAYRGWSPPVVNGTPSCAAATGTAPRGVTLPAGSPDGTYTIAVAGIDGSSANSGAGNCHIASATVLLDRRAPTVTAVIQVSGSSHAVARWGARDASPSSGLQRFAVALTVGSKTVWSATGTGTQHSFSALPHSRWHLRVTAYDAAGNAARTTAHIYDDNSFVSGSRWSRTKSAAAWRGGYTRSSRAGTSTSLTVTGRVFTLYVTKCASCGQLGVYDQRGHRLAVVDTYSSRTRYRVAVTFLTGTAPAKRTLVFRILTSKNRSSKGRTVGVDAFAYA